MDIVNESLKQCKEINPDLKVLVLSLTGSRAFGWGAGKDYDIHGVFAKEGYLNCFKTSRIQYMLTLSLTMIL